MVKQLYWIELDCAGVPNKVDTECTVYKYHLQTSYSCRHYIFL